jgi:hypothetical protein
MNSGFAAALIMSEGTATPPVDIQSLGIHERPVQIPASPSLSRNRHRDDSIIFPVPSDSVLTKDFLPQFPNLGIFFSLVAKDFKLQGPLLITQTDLVGEAFILLPDDLPG